MSEIEIRALLVGVLLAMVAFGAFGVFWALLIGGNRE